MAGLQFARCGAIRDGVPHQAHSAQLSGGQLVAVNTTLKAALAESNTENQPLNREKVNLMVQVEMLRKDLEDERELTKRWKRLKGEARDG